jgi:hypothetical protein
MIWPWKEIPRARVGKAVIIQAAIGDDGKPGRVTHDGVASLHLHQDGRWLEGRDADNRPVFQITTEGVAMAYLESDDG